MNAIQYPIPTIDAFATLYAPIFEQMTEQEGRIVAKTVINTALAWNESKKHADAYIKNLNDLQRATFKKFISIGIADPAGRFARFDHPAFQRLGLAD